MNDQTFELQTEEVISKKETIKSPIKQKINKTEENQQTNKSSCDKCDCDVRNYE